LDFSRIDSVIHTLFIQRNWNRARICDLLFDDGFPIDLGVFKNA
jgi:hypothetical protein